MTQEAILQNLKSAYSLYQAALNNGFLNIASWPTNSDSLDLNTINALLANLPGPVWKIKRLFIQASPLPQIKTTYFQATSGLEAMALDEQTLILDIGNKSLGFTICNWLAAWHNFGLEWFRLQKKYPLKAANSGQLLAHFAFLLNSTAEELMRFNEESSGRLFQALVFMAKNSWKPTILFHNSLKNSYYQSSIKEELEALDLGSHPLHLIITDSPAFTDLLSPYVRELRPVLAEWYAQNPDKVATHSRIDQNGPVKENDFYWIVRDFLMQRQDLAVEYMKANATCGIIERNGLFGNNGHFTLIDLSSLDLSVTDQRLLLGNGHHHPDGLLLILPLMDEETPHNLKTLLGSDKLAFTSISLLTRTHALNGSQIQLPMAWIDGLSGQVTNFPAQNLITGSDLGETDDNSKLSAGIVATMPGSYWVSPEIEEALSEDRWAIAYDRQSTIILNILQQSLLIRHQLVPSWQWRVIYYSSEMPLEEDYFRQGANDPAALDASYSGAIAILRSLLGTNIPQDQPSAPIRQTKRPVSTSFRLRV